jgi:hypothetical protein
VKLEFDLYWLTQAGQDPAFDAGEVRRPGAADSPEGPPLGAPIGYVLGPELRSTSPSWARGRLRLAEGLMRRPSGREIRYAYSGPGRDGSGPVMESMRESFAYLKGLKV